MSIDDSADGAAPRGVDFAALHARIAGVLHARTVDAAAVLQARARTLARPTAVERTSAGETIDLLVLRRGGSTFGVAATHVLDVTRVATLTPLPGADAPVFGVLPWRGRLLTVVDIAPSETPITRVVVVQAGAAAVGVVADAVDEVRTFDAEIHASSDGSTVRGTTVDGVSVLDPAALVRRVIPSR